MRLQGRQDRPCQLAPRRAVQQATCRQVQRLQSVHSRWSSCAVLQHRAMGQAQGSVLDAARVHHAAGTLHGMFKVGEGARRCEVR